MKHLAFFAALGLASASMPASAQVVRLDTHSLGYGTDVWFSRMYDTGSVITFMAKVQKVVETGPTTKDGAVAISYVVRPYTRQDVGNGKVRDIFQAPLTVDVGPSWFVKGQTTKVKAGDFISVTGSLFHEGNGSIVVAEMVKRNKDVLGLRRPSGQPFWMVEIDANNRANNVNTGNSAVTQTQASSDNVQFFQPDVFPNLTPGRIPNTNVVTFGAPLAHFGNVLIYDNPWYAPYPAWMSNYYWAPYSLGPTW